ncbi:MAG: terpene cyclase/mutase family protein [Candidatus Brocadiia bacterium]|jgi:geranylgeranyl transferase type-2 subunit beta|nr:terpene cyclase/mutase family protein [Candidatus Brocadiia bacterium]
MNPTGSGPYQSSLALQLKMGLGRIPHRFRLRQARYIIRRQNADGGFPGRRGPSDPYYTSFALRGAELLDVENPAELWSGAAAYLRGLGPVARDIVECFCALHIRDLVERNGCRVWTGPAETDALLGLKHVLQSYRAPEGGYAKTAGGPASLYHSFLAALSCELAGWPPPQSEEIRALVERRQCAGGGSSDVAEGPDAEQGRINPTAAAVGLLALSGGPDARPGMGTVEFVASMQRPDGGFGAHRRVPVSDLMSTFTALVTLAEGDAMGRVNMASVGRFVKALAGPDGGFRGTTLDDATDLEYTYYGLGALGLLGLQLAQSGEG